MAPNCPTDPAPVTMGAGPSARLGLSRSSTSRRRGTYEAGKDSSEKVGWFDEISRFDLVEPGDLIATGDKIARPAPGNGRQGTMDTDGSVLGTVDYVLVDDLMFYL